jgi:hypothetical protein
VFWVALGVGYAAVAALFTPLTWPAMLATLPPLVVACWAALSRPDRPPTAWPAWRRAVPWVAVIAAGATWELIALFRFPRADYPTISSIISPLAGTSWWFRFIGYLVWFAVGGWLVRR